MLTACGILENYISQRKHEDIDKQDILEEIPKFKYIQVADFNDKLIKYVFFFVYFLLSNILYKSVKG